MECFAARRMRNSQLYTIPKTVTCYNIRQPHIRMGMNLTTTDGKQPDAKRYLLYKSTSAEIEA